MAKKWLNVGDINPRESGGVFVRRVGDDMEVVSIRPWEEGPDTERYQQYVMDSANFEIIDILTHFYRKTGPYDFADWGSVLTNRTGGPRDNLGILAGDMINYWGGDCETRVETNFWGMLRSEGVTPKNFD